MTTSRPSKGHTRTPLLRKRPGLMTGLLASGITVFGCISPGTVLEDEPEEDSIMEATGGELAGPGGQGGTSGSAEGPVTGGGDAGTGGESQDDFDGDVEEHLAKLARDLAVNEIHHALVEIYFTGTVEEAISLDGFGIAVSENFEDVCPLDGLTVDAETRFVVVQKDDVECIGGSQCVAGCESIDIWADDSVQLVTFLNGSWHVIDDEEMYGRGGTILGVGQTWGACNGDGGDEFHTMTISLGFPNPGHSQEPCILNED